MPNHNGELSMQELNNAVDYVNQHGSDVERHVVNTAKQEYDTNCDYSGERAEIDRAKQGEDLIMKVYGRVQGERN